MARISTIVEEFESGRSESSLPTTAQHPAYPFPVPALCFFSAVLCVAALIFLLQLYRLDLSVPFAYQGDSVYFCVWAKGLVQGMSNGYNTNLGMPNGANWLDFPVNLTMESALARLLSLFTKQPGLVLNLLWLTGTVAASGVCTYCLIQLKIDRLASVVLGVIYALQPFTFFRQENHLNLMFYCVPLLATGAIEILGSGSQNQSRSLDPSTGRKRFDDLSSTLRRYTYLWLGCLVQGLSYVYFTFFGIVLLFVAGVCSLLVSRRKRAFLISVAAIAVAGGATLFNLLPSVSYWSKYGQNASMAYKSPSETEYYGLKIRQLLTPTWENPVRPLRQISEKVTASGVFDQNEASTAKLGTIGSIGFLMSLAGIFACCLSSDFRSRSGPNAFGPSALLNLSCLLLATVGGFAVFFSIFVSPDIRAYNRIVCFVEFFSLIPIGLVLTRIRHGLRSRRSAAAYITVLLLLFGFGIVDQASTAAITHDSERTARFHSDADFVRKLEERLPAKAMIFQLPYTPFPLDPGTQRLSPYEHGSAYIHSSALRWSWGGIAGRAPDEWVRAASRMEVPRLIEHLSKEGFAGLWIDRRGYPPGGSPEAEIQQIGDPTFVRSDGQVAFYDLRALAKLARAGQSVPLNFASGFYDLESDGTRTWRWSMKHSTITVENPFAHARKVEVHLSVLGGVPGPQSLRMSIQGHSEIISLDANPHSLARTFVIPPKANTDIALDCRCLPVNAPTDSRSMYFQVIRPTVREVR